MIIELTPWFVNGEKPVRKGVYNVSCRKEHQSGQWYAYWDGERWSRAHDNIRQAAREDRRVANPRRWHIEGSWRGLTGQASVA